MADKTDQSLRHLCDHSKISVQKTNGVGTKSSRKEIRTPAIGRDLN